MAMRYLKSLFFNCLIVFFANHILPGIEVVNQTKLPHLGGDLPFAVVLGLLNSAIHPVMRLINRDISAVRIAIVALILNFAVYAVLKFTSFVGIQVVTVEGYILASLVVTIGSFWTNFVEMKHIQHHKAASSHKSEHVQ